MKTPRRKNDAYMTPPDLAHAICSRVQETVALPTDAIVLEPGAGTGNFITAVRVAWKDAVIKAIDLKAGYRRRCMIAGANEFVKADYLKMPKERAQIYNLVIGNPPYELAEEFVERAYSEGMVVCFLLRAAFRSGVGRWVGTKKGIGIFKKCPPLLTWPVVPRPSFTGTGTEHSEYEVFLWAPQSLVDQTVRHVTPIIWRATR